MGSMFDDSLREPTRVEQMMVVTEREIIEGALYHNENVRLSDALNSEAKQHSRYVSLKDATVYSIATGREILTTKFLLISHSHVIYMTPKDAVKVTAHAAPHAPVLLSETPPMHDTDQAPLSFIPVEYSPSMDASVPDTHAANARAAVIEAHEANVVDSAETEPSSKTPRMHGKDSPAMSRQVLLQTLATIRAQVGTGGRNQNPVPPTS